MVIKVKNYSNRLISRIYIAEEKLANKDKSSEINQNETNEKKSRRPEQRIKELCD